MSGPDRPPQLSRLVSQFRAGRLGRREFLRQMVACGLASSAAYAVLGEAESVAAPPSTQALGEEGAPRTYPPAKPPTNGPQPPRRPTTMAVGEESQGRSVTTYAIGEEESRTAPVTTYAIGEEGQPPQCERRPVTTQAIGEESPPARVTTRAVGEESPPPQVTTWARGEESSRPDVTTQAFGEEGQPRAPTTGAVGEESPPRRATTLRVGEEGNPPNSGGTPTEQPRQSPLNKLPQIWNSFRRW